MIYSMMDEERAYLERVLSASDLTKKDRKFIEDLTSKAEDEESSIGYYYYKRKSKYELEVSKKTEKMDRVGFSDLFPKEVEGGLKALLGEEFFAIFMKIGENIIKYPYTTGYYRKPIRSKNYKYHFEHLLEIVDILIKMRAFDLSIIRVLKRDYDTRALYNIRVEEALAAALDLGDSELKSYLKELLTAENNHEVLSYDVFLGIFMAEDEELFELTKGLLLAAKLQEGLRQAICETMDRGSFPHFKEMFSVIYEHNLLRFSSVKRALATWTGLSEENSDRISKKELELIARLLEDEDYADELFKSRDNVELYLGLWRKGNTEVETAIAEVLKIVETGEKHNRLLTSYYLNFIGEKDLKRKVGLEMIRQYPGDKEVLACFLKDAFYVGAHNYYLRRMIQELSEEGEGPNELQKLREDGPHFFEILEAHLLQMKTKTLTLSPCIFPWYSVELDREDLVSAMFQITVLVSEKDLKDRFTQYVKQGSSYFRGEMIEVLYKKPEGKVQEGFIISMLSDRNCNSDTLFKIVRENKLFLPNRETIEDLLRLKTPEIRKNTLDLLGEQEKEALSLTLERLLKTKDENKRLGALDLLGRAKKKGSYTGEELRTFISSMGDISSSEEVLVNVLLEKKETKDITKIAYDENYEKDYVLEFSKKEEGILKKLGGLLKKKEVRGEVIKIDNSLEIRDIYNKKTADLYAILKSLSELIEKHADYEYTTNYGIKTLIRDQLTKEKVDEGQPSYVLYLHNLPLFEVWEKFYREEIRDIKTLFQLVTLIDVTTDGYYYEREKVFQSITSEILGFDITALKRLINEKELSYGKSGHLRNLINGMYAEFKTEDRDYVRRASLSILSALYLKLDRPRFFNPVTYSWCKETHEVLFEKSAFFSSLLNELDAVLTKEEFQEVFFLRLSFYKELQEYAKANDIKFSYTFLPYSFIVKAALLGIVDISMFYQFAFDDLSAYINSLNYDIYGPLYKYERVLKDDYLQNEERRAFAREKGRELIDLILDHEL